MRDLTATPRAGFKGGGLRVGGEERRGVDGRKEKDGEGRERGGRERGLCAPLTKIPTGIRG